MLWISQNTVILSDIQSNNIKLIKIDYTSLSGLGEIYIECVKYTK